MARGREAGFSTRQGDFATCNKCRRSLASARFRTRTVGDHTYLRSTCKECEKPIVSRAVRAWQKRNPERLREASRRYRVTHPGRELARHTRRQAAIETGNVSDEQLQDLFLVWEYSCAYCGSPHRLTFDHVMPLARGGEHTIANIVPACRSCNSSKKDRTPEEWRAHGIA